MKKSYRKPEIAFESFGISSNFANTLSALCTYTPSSTNDCGYTIEGLTIFVPEVSGCTFVSGDGTFGLCYYVPTGDNNIFLS